MAKNTNSKKMTALLVALVLVTSLFVGGTIARYITSTSSEDSARVAVWGINEVGTTMDLFENEYTIDGSGELKAKSADESEDIIAPGLNGASEFKIVNTSTLKPEVMYEIAISLDDSEIADEIKNHPGIEWKVDNGEWGTWEEFKTELLSLSGDPSGVKTYAPLDVNHEFANGKTHTVAWQWIMDSGYDEEDTAMGNLAATGQDITAKLSIKVTARQTDIDSTGMLEGNGSVFNTNDPQPLTFRADADYSTFSNVEIDGTEINPSNYETEEGSIIVKLKKSYLSTLSTGSHKISINTTNGKSIKSKFSVKNEDVITHNGKIPEGGTYYVNVQKNQYDYYDYQDYSTASAVYTAGDNFPTPQKGDVYVYGDYEYRYRVSFLGATFDDVSNSDTETEWTARVLDTEKTTYGPIISFIGDKKVNNLSYTFYGCSNMTSAPKLPEHTFDLPSTFQGTSKLTTPPELPESVKYLNTTFQFSGITTAPELPSGVTSLYGTFWGSAITKAPVIPEKVRITEMVFMQCENLSGKVVINAEHIDDIDMGMFIGVPNPIILSGTNSQLDEIVEIYTQYDINISVEK